MVTLVAAVTAVVEMVKAGDVVAPAATVTVAGTVAAVVLLLVRLTTAPPAGAGLFSVTVFCAAGLPPTTDAGDSVTSDTEDAAPPGGLTTRVAVAVAPPLEAETVILVALVTAVVAMVKAGDTVAPAATVTDAGSVATAGLLLVRATTAPPAGAGLFRVTVF